MMNVNLENLKETYDYIRNRYKEEPEIGIVLGTGLGKLAEAIQEERSLKYSLIPHFPISTVESHFGRLIFGTLGNKKVVAMQGRFHYYEGYTMQQITYPIRLMKLLGVKALFVSNASGAVNLDKLKTGDIMIINDHINLLPDNPLRGQNVDAFGPRFPDMSQPYDLEFIEKAKRIAKEENIDVKEGVYAAVMGPNLETKAEYNYVRIIGADVVGMSTVPEVLVARHMNMRVFAISVITDEGHPVNLKPVNLEEIIQVAESKEPYMTRIMQRLIEEIEL